MIRKRRTPIAALVLVAGATLAHAQTPSPLPEAPVVFRIEDSPGQALAGDFIDAIFIAEAGARGGPGYPVEMRLTPGGRQAFKTLTGANIGRTLRVFLHGSLLFSASIMEPVDSDYFLMTNAGMDRELLAEMAKGAGITISATSLRPNTEVFIGIESTEKPSDFDRGYLVITAGQDSEPALTPGFLEGLDAAARKVGMRTIRVEELTNVALDDLVVLVASITGDEHQALSIEIDLGLIRVVGSGESPRIERIWRGVFGLTREFYRQDAERILARIAGYLGSGSFFASETW